MAKASVLAGTTSGSVNVFIQDSSSTVGAGLAGLVFNTANLVAYYTFTGANATAVAISLATLAAVNSAFSSGGFKELDATHMKGLYRLDLPNAALAAASGQLVTVMLSGAANMAPCVLEIELTATNNQSATAFMTSVGSVTGAVGSVTGAVGSVTGAVGSVTGAVGSVTGAVGSVTGAVGSVAAGGIIAATFGANAIDAAALATDAGQEIADRLLARSAAGGSDGTRPVKNAFKRLVNRAGVAAGTMTVYESDDATGAWTAAVTTAAGNPVSDLDPT